MKQIKTVTVRIDAAEQFDKEVNEALTEGWMLIKRDVLPPFDGTQHFVHRMLYAELEKDSITEAEKCCANCEHSERDGHESPCCYCEDASEWVPQE